MGRGLGSMKTLSSSQKISQQYPYEDQLPCIRDVLPPGILDRVPSQSNLNEMSSTSLKCQSPARSTSSTISYPQPTLEREHALDHVEDKYDGYHPFVSSNRLQPQLPNVIKSCNAIMEYDINASLPPPVILSKSQQAPWAVESMPFRATTITDPLPNTRSRDSCRQHKVRDESQKQQIRDRQHSDKEKWRRDKIAIYTAIKRIMQQVLPWPGAMCLTPVSTEPCEVKHCFPRKSLTPQYTSKYSSGKGAHHAQNNKDDSKSVVLFWDVLWKFSIVVHFLQDEVRTILEEVEELIDQSLDVKEKKLSQAMDKKAKQQAERDITAKAAYGVLRYMLDQCRSHKIEIDEGIMARQEIRRFRMGMEAVEEREGCWEERRGTTGFSRTFSEYEEGDDVEERAGKRHRRMTSEESCPLDEDQ